MLKSNPEQVFNMDETGLFWKRTPTCTFIMKDEAKAPEFKAQKDRVTRFMINLGLIYKSKNPRPLKNKSKISLPVYWMHNTKVWMTKVLILDRFEGCFIPEVRRYLILKCFCS